MAIQNDKLMNLADGKVLYDDLRERVEGKYTKPATGIPATDIASEVITDIREKLNTPVYVSGSTPSITAKPGDNYICGEVSTIEIILPASGSVDVIFTSGSTAAELTITPPTGQTMKWANGFNPASLNANTIYKLTITNNLGIAYSWN